MFCPLSGGNWNNSSNAGVWYLNLNNSRSNSNNNIGFRSDSAPPKVTRCYMVPREILSCFSEIGVCTPF